MKLLTKSQTQVVVEELTERKKALENIPHSQKGYTKSINRASTINKIIKRLNGTK